MRKLLGSLTTTVAVVVFVVLVLATAALSFFPAARAVVSPLVCAESEHLTLTDDYCVTTEGGCWEFRCEGPGIARNVTIIIMAGICGVFWVIIGILALAERISGQNKPEVLYPPPEE